MIDLSGLIEKSTDGDWPRDAMIRTAFAQPDDDAAVPRWRQVADNLRPMV